MGQAHSHKAASRSAPREMLADPRGASRFVCRRNAPSSKNLNVYKDSIHGPMWLLVKKRGQTLRGRDPTILVLENLNKDVLCVARLEHRNDDFFNPTYSLKNFEKRALHNQVEIGKTKHETIETIARDTAEWKCQTRTTIFRSHSMTEPVAEVDVEAYGLIARDTQKIKGRDSENFPSIKTDFKETKLVGRIQYMIRLVGGSELFITIVDPNSTEPKWSSPFFNADVTQSTSGEQVWNVETKQEYDPAISLLIALVCSSVLCPEKIMRYIPIKWP